MKRRLLRLVVGVGVFAFVGAVDGFAEEKQTVVLGVGNRSCGSWNQARHPVGMMSDVYEAWVAGFLSGANSILADSKDNIDTLKQGRKRHGCGGAMGMD